MLFGGHNGGLELRKRASGALALRGRFPYGKRAVLSDGGRTGRPRKEVIAPRAFAYRVERPEEDIHFLVGHSYDQPLASRGAGTLTLQDTEEALIFEAEISEQIQRATFWTNFWAAFESGLMVGLSPGFRIPPPRTVPDAETIEEEDPSEGTAIIRTVNQALLYEISAVTRPAYSETQIEARNWSPGIHDAKQTVPHHLNRWRL